MTRRRKAVLLSMAAVVALVMAGAAGAVVRYTIFTIQNHHYAHLAGTNVYCLNSVNKHQQRAFVCLIYGPKYPAANTYTVVVGQPGLEIGRWSATGKTVSTLRKFTNP